MSDSMEPVRRIVGLTRQRAQVLSQIDHEVAEAYFDARRAGPDVFEEAIRLGPLSRSAAFAATASVNEAKGRHIRWKDAVR